MHLLNIMSMCYTLCLKHTRSKLPSSNLNKIKSLSQSVLSVTSLIVITCLVSPFTYIVLQVSFRIVDQGEFTHLIILVCHTLTLFNIDMTHDDTSITFVTKNHLTESLSLKNLYKRVHYLSLFNFIFLDNIYYANNMSFIPTQLTIHII